jgi:hypothetical protein
MFDLFFPYLLGLALGMDPAAADTADRPQEAVPARTVRAPEPQEATGRFTSALEVRPILDMTRANWVAVRPYEGQDWLYFTHLVSWRCGLWEVRYGINEAPATTVLALEPCHEDTTQPNAVTDIEAFPIFVTFPLESVDSVTVEIDYDDGTSDLARFSRQEILLP